MPNPIHIPNDSLILLIGTAGAGKSHFANRFFRPSEIVSSDYCRELVCDDATDQSSSAEAFKVFHTIIESRLKLGKLAVADATNLKASSREQLYKLLAEDTNKKVFGFLIDSSPEVAKQQNTARTRMVPAWVIDKHAEQLKVARKDLENEPITLSVRAVKPPDSSVGI